MFNRFLSPLAQASRRTPGADWTPNDIASILAWFDFSDITTLFKESNGTDAVTSDGDVIGYAADKSASGFNAIQATTSKKPLYKTNIKNGLGVCRTDGEINDALDITGITSNVGAKTILFAADIKSANGGPYLMDSQSGRLIIAAVNNDGSDKTGWYDVPWKPVGVKATGWQSLTYSLNPATVGTVYRNNVSIGTAAYNSKALGGSTHLFSSFNGLGSFISIDAGEIVICDDVLSAGDFTSLMDYIGTKWAVH